MFGPLVAAGLEGVDPDSGPIVDLGAGTGRGVLAVAAALPTADIIAVEPSAAMRAVLMARVGSDERLRQRVTVVGGDLDAVRTPEPFAAVLAMNMIGHLDRTARKVFWTSLARRLAPGGPLVVNLQPPSEAVEVMETPASAVVVGRRRYLGSGRAAPTAADQVTWHMTYRTVEDGVTVAEERVSYSWWVLSEAGLRDELSVAGLHAEHLGPPEAGVYIGRRPAGR
ncbi:class I SAM-dependent methyltransferase [Jiangella ureilytica]|uniref:Class I SAM-dependent methyltransferase n=2 Tax=Jiangella ureilytica TaxID=2530374 RepID=A0A4R4RM63_9ACTN|nr:class I SAM-dependent methyltransferase [Jiangella ureilytica]